MRPCVLNHGYSGLRYWNARHSGSVNIAVSVSASTSRQMRALGPAGFPATVCPFVNSLWVSISTTAVGALNRQGLVAQPVAGISLVQLPFDAESASLTVWTQASTA